LKRDLVLVHVWINNAIVVLVADLSWIKMHYAKRTNTVVITDIPSENIFGFSAATETTSRISTLHLSHQCRSFLTSEASTKTLAVHSPKLTLSTSGGGASTKLSLAIGMCHLRLPSSSALAKPWAIPQSCHSSLVYSCHTDVPPTTVSSCLGD
jgi:hypothetical protein